MNGNIGGAFGGLAVYHHIILHYKWQRAKCFRYHHQAHTRNTARTYENIHRGRYEINTFMQMLSLWLASFMQIIRLQMFGVRKTRMDTV